VVLVAALLATPVPAPRSVCTVTDDRLAELSGLAVLGSQLWAVDDGGREVAVHRLDGDCAVVDTRTADIDPYDAEDLAVGPDGALWVADTGDNDRDRETVAVVVLPERGEARLHRLAYPDGPHDAEALLVDAAGVPHVITKEAGQPAGVYRTAAPPDGTGPTPLERVGEVALPASETEGGPLGGFGTRTVTGAGASADGTVVALRTYTDAWLYPVPDGDLAAALAGDPVRVPLPGEPQGEAVAFTADGALLSASEARGGPGELRTVPGAAALVGVVPVADGPAPAVEPAAPTWWPGLVGAGGAVGLLALAGIGLAWRARRR
jgi:hypothetical protein